MVNNVSILVIYKRKNDVYVYNSIGVINNETKEVLWDSSDIDDAIISIIQTDYRNLIGGSTNHKKVLSELGLIDIEGDYASIPVDIVIDKDYIFSEDEKNFSVELSPWLQSLLIKDNKLIPTYNIIINELHKLFYGTKIISDTKSDTKYIQYPQVDTEIEDINIPLEYELVPQGLLEIYAQLGVNLLEEVQEEVQLDYKAIKALAKLIKTGVKEKIVGQDHVVDTLVHSICQNHLISGTELEKTEKSCIFLTGKEGTGKKTVIDEIANLYDIKYEVLSCKNLLANIFEYDAISYSLASLIEKYDGDVENAEKGILVIDEIEFLINCNWIQKQTIQLVQKELAKLIKGKTYHPTEQVSFDTTNLNVIVMGDLDLIEKRKTCGFVMPEQEKSNSKERDLSSSGFQGDFVNVFTDVVETKCYTERDLINILNKSSISPKKEFEQLVEMFGKEVMYEDENAFISYIATEALKLGKGASGLKIVMNQIKKGLMPRLFDDTDIIYITSDMINNIGVQRVRG